MYLQPDETPSASPANVEKSEKSDLMTALKIIVNQHISQIEELRRHYPLDAIDLVASKIQQNKSLNKAVREELAALHGKIRIVVEQVANTIENAAYAQTTSEIESRDLSFNDKAKSLSLIQADKRKLVSIRTLNLVIEVFNQFNTAIEEQINSAIMQKDIRAEKNYLLANAMIFYELTDFAIEYISTFSVDGIAELKEIYEQAMTDLEASRQYIVKMEESLKDPNIFEDEKNITRMSIEAHSKALTLTEGEWKQIFMENDQIGKELKNINNFLPTLKSMRTRAEAQLSILESMSVLQLVKNSLGSFQKTFSTLRSFKIAPLDPDRVKRLLNIN